MRDAWGETATMTTMTGSGAPPAPRAAGVDRSSGVEAPQAPPTPPAGRLLRRGDSSGGPWGLEGGRKAVIPVIVGVWLDASINYDRYDKAMTRGMTGVLEGCLG